MLLLGGDAIPRGPLFEVFHECCWQISDQKLRHASNDSIRASLVN